MTADCLLDIFSSCIFLVNFYSSPFTCACWVCFVTDTLLSSTISEPPSVECQHLLIPTRSNACVAKIDLDLKSQPNDWAMRYSSLAEGDYALTNRNRVFYAITNCASIVSLAPTRLPWPPRHLSEGYDSCTRSCCRGSNWVPSVYQSDALTTRPSVPLLCWLTSYHMQI